MRGSSSKHGSWWWYQEGEPNPALAQGFRGGPLRGCRALLSPKGQATVSQGTKSLALWVKGQAWADREVSKSRGILGTAAG